MGKIVMCQMLSIHHWCWQLWSCSKTNSCFFFSCLLFIFVAWGSGRWRVSRELTPHRKWNVWGFSCLESCSGCPKCFSSPLNPASTPAVPLDLVVSFLVCGVFCSNYHITFSFTLPYPNLLLTLNTPCNTKHGLMLLWVQNSWFMQITWVSSYLSIYYIYWIHSDALNKTWMHSL